MSMKLIRIKDVMDRTGLAKSTVYKYISKGWLPKPLKPGGRMSAWVEEEIDAYIQELIQKRDMDQE
ncbi:helix-turn-helix transcriptional regulator [Halomonas daqiaonensis]|uniref:Transcriptional regulator, AlpA family n=1 Tax=Halomonas daqiaonensis TaxID=650850 RepID=A0A1H7NYK0_9GAMM|nr:AlpA family transcriptional regulator [Halomonas daqiaonensis]SEL28632.1 transcriptional regulator, AlpA family [Halomonas daqiaonensis]